MGPTPYARAVVPHHSNFSISTIPPLPIHSLCPLLRSLTHPIHLRNPVLSLPINPYSPSLTQLALSRPITHLLPLTPYPPNPLSPSQPFSPSPLNQPPHRFSLQPTLPTPTPSSVITLNTTPSVSVTLDQQGINKLNPQYKTINFKM